ncbi:MAG: RNA polymerase factor sigma-32 [Alphaproteobacteria bacterium]|jgi:RNA polymerase sigma-32 factor|nr:RNA polymerase factor sigma-32 [Pseudomonadota bacterium]MCZ6467757.1 RNA polymerase factor sigma-32 [Alphaproteobacteria bacterium]MCZ6607924.1 RNA polymerase factor sigma-32 [Alphaproteobacteria bacterium]
MTNATTGIRRGLLAAAVDEPVLGRDEERELARRAEAGDADAAGRLIASHLRFVIKIARRYRGSGLPMSDLIQEGTVGLIRAVRRFNPDRGVRLSTYAMWWIRSAIQDHVMHSWSLVRMGTTNAQKAMILRLRQMTAELIGGAEGLSDEITARLAKSFGATANEVATLARRLAGGDWSLDQPMAGPDGDQRTWMDCLTSDAPTPEQAVAEASERRFVSEIVGKALAMLPPREQLVIRKRYFEDVRQTFEAIGRELGVSKDRVRQLETRALAKLRELLQPALAGNRS